MNAPRFSAREATIKLRRAAEGESDEDLAAVLYGIANYIAGTAGIARCPCGRREGYGRETYAEVAHAYVAGYEHGADAYGTVKLGRALHDADLSI